MLQLVGKYQLHKASAFRVGKQTFCVGVPISARVTSMPPVFPVCVCWQTLFSLFFLFGGVGKLGVKEEEKFSPPPALRSFLDVLHRGKKSWFPSPPTRVVFLVKGRTEKAYYAPSPVQTTLPFFVGEKTNWVPKILGEKERTRMGGRGSPFSPQKRGRKKPQVPDSPPHSISPKRRLEKTRWLSFL